MGRITATMDKNTLSLLEIEQKVHGAYSYWQLDHPVVIGRNNNAKVQYHKKTIYSITQRLPFMDIEELVLLSELTLEMLCWLLPLP